MSSAKGLPLNVVFISPQRLHVSVMLPFCVQVAAFRDVSLKLCPNAGISCSDFTSPQRLQTTDRLPFAVQVAATVFS